MRDLAMQCAIDMAETAIQFGCFPDAALLYADDIRFRYMERRKLAAQESRIIVRLRRQHSEERTCPFCGMAFRVVVHARRGRVRVFCSDSCRVAKHKREKNKATNDFFEGVCAVVPSSRSLDRDTWH